MLDTSYGFNNLLKEVNMLILRVINIFQALKKLYSRTSQLANKSVPRSKDHLALMVRILIRNGQCPFLSCFLASSYLSTQENGC